MKDTAGIKRITILIIILCCIGVIQGSAKVFFRWRSSSDINSSINAIGGNEAYSSSMNINGRPGTISVHAFDIPYDATLARLRSTFNINGFQHTGPGTAYAVISEDDLIRRLLVARIQNRTIAFLIEQSSDDYKHSRNPKRHLMQEAPGYPGATPLLYACDKGTGMSIASATTPDSPSDIQTFYNNRLTADGWTPAFPASDSRTTGAMTTYTRNNELFCAHTSFNRTDNSTTVVLLYKINRIN